MQSAGATILVTSGAEPEALTEAPFVSSYDSPTAMTVKWAAPSYDGGFTITSVKVYVDNSELVELNQSLNYYQMTGLTLGTSYKVQVSALNEIGESALSPSNMIVFANLPDEPDSLTLTPNDSPATILVEWTAPASVNGDDVSGYKVYVDNGRGGPFNLAFDASEFPSSYSYTINDLDCGYLYMVRVTAINVVGEGPYVSASVHLGLPPLNPKSPAMISVVPEDELTISWQRPDSDGCLPLTKYVINKDGVDLADIVSPSATAFTDDITTGGAIGTEITYKVKAVNVNGESAYS